MLSFLKFFNNASAAEQAAMATVEAETKKVAAIASAAAQAVDTKYHEGVQFTEAEITEMRDRYKPNRITKAARPADTPARAFVGNTLEQLTKARDNYTTERDLLAKDIAKLTDEHGQLETSLAVLQVAIEKLLPVAPASAPMPSAAPWTQADIDAAAAKAVASELGGNS